MGVILSVQGAAFVHERSQEKPRNDAIAFTHAVGKVFCVRERVKKQQCSKQQLIDFYELYRGATYCNGSNSVQKNSGNSTKHSPSKVAG